MKGITKESRKGRKKERGLPKGNIFGHNYECEGKKEIPFYNTNRTIYLYTLYDNILDDEIYVKIQCC